jgi:hypothetical protein
MKPLICIECTEGNLIREAPCLRWLREGQSARLVELSPTECTECGTHYTFESTVAVMPDAPKVLPAQHLSPTPTVRGFDLRIEQEESDDGLDAAYCSIRLEAPANRVKVLR